MIQKTQFLYKMECLFQDTNDCTYLSASFGRNALYKNAIILLYSVYSVIAIVFLHYYDYANMLNCSIILCAN